MQCFLPEHVRNRLFLETRTRRLIWCRAVEKVLRVHFIMWTENERKESGEEDEYEILYKDWRSFIETPY